MKKVAVFIVNPIRSPYKNDQYDSFKSEGRYPLNMGFGLALLGFEVNIIMNEWTVSNKQVFNNVYLSNIPKYSHYDYVLTWALNTLDIVNFDKGIFMDWAIQFTDKVHQFTNVTKKDVTYTNASKHLINWAQKHEIKYPFKVGYLPALFPIPSINIGFIPYKFEPVNSELKIYLRYIKTINEKYLSKEQLIINFFRSKGYKVKLYVHTDSKEITSPFKDCNTDYINNIEARYIDVINTINSTDICISIGSGCSAPILPDIISLGKPMIFISDIFINLEEDIFTNNLYEYPEYLLYLQETDEESIKKLERFILNPKESYDKFKESFKDLDFNNWKEHAKKFFIP